MLILGRGVYGVCVYMCMVTIAILLSAGNAGFETADNIVGHTAYIHMASR